MNENSNTLIFYNLVTVGPHKTAKAWCINNQKEKENFTIAVLTLDNEMHTKDCDNNLSWKIQTTKSIF